MDTFSTLPLRQIYKVVTRCPVVQANGLKEYPVMKKYIDDIKDFTQKSLQLRNAPKKKNLRLRTYLDEQEKKHRHIPGPGKYHIENDWHLPEQRNKKVSERKTYLDEIVRSMKRNKSPAPGQHQSIDFKHSQSASKLNYKAQKEKQRVFYSDQNQYAGAHLPGPGQYEVTQRVKTDFRHANDNPEKSMKKFRAMSEKRIQTLPKLPDMATYSPEECSFFTFETAKKTKPSKKSFGVGERFKTLPQGSGLGPNKYGLINEWNGKGSNNKKYEKHGLDFLSKPQLRVYN